MVFGLDSKNKIMSEENMISDTSEWERVIPKRKLTEEEKEFLLNDEQVRNRIIEGLIRDLKAL